MPVLITGGTGFVGLNLAEHLLARGEDVVLFAATPPPTGAVAFLSRLSGKLKLVDGDVRDRNRLELVVADPAVDRIVHGAAITPGPDRERRDFATIVEVNVSGTANLLEAARKAGRRRILYLSSVAVYGRNAALAGELDESRTAPAPESLYAITKLAAERLSLRHRALFGLDLVVARLGAVFGRWEYSTGVRDTVSVPYQLAAVAAKGGEARLPPALPKDWIYGPDVARGLALLLDLASPRFELYNLGPGRAWAPEAFCASLGRWFPSFSYRTVGTADEANIDFYGAEQRSPMSIRRLREDTGFEPEFDLEAAVADYAAWLRRWPSLHGRFE